LINKLNESEAEAAETQCWLEYSVKCAYLDPQLGRELHKEYDHITIKSVTMINSPEKWVIG
jgi:four helix bundle protein